MIRHKYEMASYTTKPEYRQALQELIKFEIQALIERLADTGEEAVILTASIVDNVSTQFGSSKGEGFLGKQSNLSSKFLSFCCDEATQSSADEMSCSYEESVVSKNTASDGDKHRKICDGSLDIPDRTVELSLKTENSKDDDECNEAFGVDILKTSLRLTSLGKSEVAKETSSLNSSDVKDGLVPERPTSVSSASNSVDLQSNLPFNNDLQCKICNRFFRSMHTLAQHVRFHAVKSYKCSACSKVFSIKASLKQHVCSRELLKSFKCEICDASFMDQGLWKRHKERHFGIRNHSCDVCGMAFYEKYSLRVHQTSHFYTSLKSDKDVSPEFTCHICQKYFKTKKDMKNHLVAHSTKKYSCEFCNKRFSLKFNYLRHRRIHTGDRPYKCGVCEHAFSDGSAWAKHVKMHSGIKPYSCSICNKVFYDKFSCNQHKKSCRKAKNSSRQSDSSKFSDLHVDRSDQKVTQDKSTSKQEYDISDSESQIGAEKVPYMIENESEHYQQSQLIESGFDPGFLEKNEKVGVVKKSPSHDPLVTAVVENVKHDKKFQKDFVERHMPDKSFDSENEFLSSNFPEGTEMLDNDAFAFTENEVDGNETEDQSDSNDIYPKSQKHKKVLKSHLASHIRRRRGKQRRGRRPSRKHFRLIPESPAKCQRCNKTFKTDSTLKKHQQVHCMLKKLYKCRYCGRQLSSNSALLRHERIHRGERPYECYICQKGFADKSGCIRHIRHHLSSTARLNILKPLSEDDVRNKVPHTHTASFSESGGSNIQEQSALDQNKPQNLGLGCHTNKNNLKTEVEQNYSNDNADETDTLTECLEVNSAEQNVKISEQNQSYNVSQNTEESYIVDSCWSESLGFDTDIHTFEETAESLKGDSAESRAENSLQSSGTNLYRCGFCGLLFDSEANCSIHISEDCSSYRNSVSAAVDSIPTSKPSCSKPFPVMTESSAQSSATGFLKTNITVTESSTVMEKQIVSKDRFEFINLQQTSRNTNANSVATTSLLAGQQTQIAAQKPQFVCATIPSPGIQGSANVRLLLTDKGQKSLLASVRLQPRSAEFVSKSSQSSPAVSLLTSKPVQNTSLNHPTLQLMTANQVNQTGSSNNLLTAVPASRETVNNSIQTTRSGEQMNLVMRSSVGGKPGSFSSKPKSFGGKPKSASTLQNKCLVCGKTFKNKHTLKQHTTIHQDRKFACEYCTKKFHNKYGYERHLRIHTGEKPYVCSVCSRGFTDKSHLLKHSRQCFPKDA